MLFDLGVRVGVAVAQSETTHRVVSNLYNNLWSFGRRHMSPGVPMPLCLLGFWSNFFAGLYPWSTIYLSLHHTTMHEIFKVGRPGNEASCWRSKVLSPGSGTRLGQVPRPRTRVRVRAWRLSALTSRISLCTDFPHEKKITDLPHI